MTNIVILTGAGISQESGLDTFRTQNGIWSKVRLEDVATPDGFARNPGLVHDFYNARRRALTDPAIIPNAAHQALAQLEAAWPGQFLLVTQNIDDLHQRAGSRNLLAMHGELRKIRCDACGACLPWDDDLSLDTPCPACAIAGQLRPHVVWFTEMPFHLHQIGRAIAKADLFVSIGTSGHVYPAAGFVAEARHHGALTVELNLEPSAGSFQFDEALHGPATEIVPAFVDRLLASDLMRAASP